MNKETGRNRAEETEERQEKSKDIKERVSGNEEKPSCKNCGIDREI